MKKRGSYFFATIAFILFSNILFGITKEYLWSALTFSDSPEANEAARSLALKNPSVLKEVLFISDNEMDNVVGRESAFLLLKYCSQNHIIPTGEFFDCAIDFIVQIPKIVFPNHVTTEKLKFETILSTYGWDFEKEDYVISTPEAFSALTILLDKMYEKGLLRQEKLLNSLKRKIEESKRMCERTTTNSINAAVLILQNVISETGDRKQQGFEDGAANIFTGFCKRMVSHLMKKNVSNK